MPVTFRSPSKPAESGPIFVRCPPNRIVVPLCPPDRYTVTKLHWLERPNGSYPCLGEDCQLCPAYAFEFTYAPGLMWSPRAGRWLEGILCLGHPDGTLCQEEFTGVPIIMGKSKEHNGEKSRIVFYGKATDASMRPPPPKQPFNVQPYLLRRWGLFDEAALKGCDFHQAEPTLQFPDADAG